MKERFAVKVVPNARRESVEPTAAGFTVRVHAPAQEGRANERMIELLSGHLHVPKSRIRIVSGHVSKIKHLQII